MALDTATYQPYITAGLNTAANVNSNTTAAAYTPYTSSAANAPVKTAMYDYTAAAPMQQVAAKDYTGLMGGDYAALQTALTQPGQQAATNAYNTGTQNLNNTMSGRGLYGSSIMQQQQTQGLDREFQNASASNASNAAAQRYQMEQTGLKDMNAYNAQETAGLRAQNSELAKYGAADADSRNQYNNLSYNADKQYNEQLNNWNNQQNYEKNFLYPQAKQAFDQSQQEMIMNRGLALAGQGAPLLTAAETSANMQAQIAAQQAAAAQNSSAQLWGSALGAVGQVGGGLMASPYTWQSNLGIE